MAYRVKNIDLAQVKALEANKDVNSCISKKEGEVVVAVHPIHANDITKGIREELNVMASRYSKDLGGIPMGYEKVKVAATGGLMHTSPYIYYRVQAIFYIFSPEVGSLLQATVRKKAPNYLGCLVHGMFNIAVPRPNNISREEWVGTTLNEDDVISISVTSIDMSFYLPMLRGTIESVVSKAVPPTCDTEIVEEDNNCIEDTLGQSLVDSGISGSEGEHETNTGEGQDDKMDISDGGNVKSMKRRSTEGIEDKTDKIDTTEEESFKKESKSKKRKSTAGIDDDTNGETNKMDKHKKIKKKKSDSVEVGEDREAKKKKKKDSAIKQEFDLSEVVNSNDSLVVKEKKKKKKDTSIKKEFDLSEVVSNDDSIVVGKKKKKKKDTSIKQEFDLSEVVSNDDSFVVREKKKKKKDTAIKQDFDSSEEKLKKKKKKNTDAESEGIKKENITDVESDGIKKKKKKDADAEPKGKIKKKKSKLPID